MKNIANPITAKWSNTPRHDHEEAGISMESRLIARKLTAEANKRSKADKKRIEAHSRMLKMTGKLKPRARKPKEV